MAIQASYAVGNSARGKFKCRRAYNTQKEDDMKYIGFAVSDSMFEGDCTIVRKSLSADEVRALAEAGELTPCLNPSHQATIDAMRQRFGIDVAIPEAPPKVSLGVGDSVVVMGVRGLPRLTDRHEYSEEEIAAATFTFSEYTAQEEPTIYLVGTVSFSGDQGGDLPNAAEFPEYSFASLEEAEEEYERISLYDQSWSFGFQEAYLVEARNGELELLKGRCRV